MGDESYTFSTARTRLEDIVTQVRKKDTSLEKSLDLLEEGVRLANACTELIDHADWTAAGAPVDGEAAAAEETVVETAEALGDDVDDSWADDSAPADELGADDDPSAFER